MYFKHKNQKRKNTEKNCLSNSNSDTIYFSKNNQMLFFDYGKIQMEILISSKNLVLNVDNTKIIFEEQSTRQSVCNRHNIRNFLIMRFFRNNFTKSAKKKQPIFEPVFFVPYL